MPGALVTGGAGFIGHHLTRALLDRGQHVTVLDNLSTGNRLRVPGDDDQFSFVRGDVRDPAALDAAMAGCSVVFHLAARVSIGDSFADPEQTSAVNVGGSIEVMRAAARAGVSRVILASSCAVYDEGAAPHVESERLNPRSPYAASKAAAEHFVHAIGAETAVETVALRYFNVFGPGQDPHHEYAAVIPRFIAAALSTEPATVYGDGLQSRDFVYVSDVVAATMLAASAAGVSGMTFNVGSGVSQTVLEVHTAVAAAAKTSHGARPPEPIFMPARPHELRHSSADIGLAHRALGYQVRVGFEDGIGRTIAALHVASVV